MMAINSIAIYFCLIIYQTKLVMRHICFSFILLAFALRLSAQLPIASYTFSGNANDNSGNNLHGTIIGSPTFVADRYGNANGAIAFTGDLSKRIEINDNVLFHAPSITIAAWFKYNANLNYQGVVDKPLGTGNSDSWLFGVENNNLQATWIANSATAPTFSKVNGVAGSGQWHYAVSTFDNTSKLHKYYVDGVLKATNTFNSTIGYDASKIFIGVAVENGSLNFPLNGDIDEIEIYNTALTASQIQTKFLSSVQQTLAGSGKAISFDGTNDMILTPAGFMNGVTQFTMDFWVKTTDSGAGPQYWQHPTLIGNATAGSGSGDFGIMVSSGNLAAFSGLTASGDNAVITTKRINDNKWHHIAAVNDGTFISFYVDGIKLPETLGVGIGTGLTTNTVPLGIGSNNNAFYNFTQLEGTIDEVRFWNTALSQTQIRDRMCQTITATDPIYSNLVAYYNFDEQCGASALDATAHANQGLFTNAPSRVLSGAPLGNASAYDYANTIKTASISHANGENFSVTSTAGNPNGIHIYRVDSPPNTLSGVATLGTTNKYFGVFQIGGTTPEYTAVYHYNGNTYVTAENESTLVLYKRNENASTSWSNAAATLDMLTKSLTCTGQSTEYVLGVAGVALPLRLITFTASLKSSIVGLHWQIADERNVSHFVIERSNDGRSFKPIGKTIITDQRDYYFDDTLPMPGIAYYRLKTVDTDGKYSHSAIINVHLRATDSFTIFPNPASETLTVSGVQANSAVKFFTLDGKLVKEVALTPDMKINIKGFQKGTYLIHYVNKTGVLSKKLIVN